MQNAKIKLGILGASGKLGSMIARAALLDPRFALCGVFVHAQSSSLNKTYQDQLHYRCAPDAELDVLIDVSLPESLATLPRYLSTRTALVSGVTGMRAEQMQQLKSICQGRALLHTHNFSKGIAVLSALLARCGAALTGYDIGITDLHHAQKRDAPSGTALTLEAALRSGGATNVQHQALRIGSIIGQHTVHFAGCGEELELTHRISDRKVFAEGALDAAAFLANQEPGHYSMADCLGI